MKRAAVILLLFLPLASAGLKAQTLSGVYISGTPNISSVLTGNYTGDLGATGDHYKYEWFSTSPRTLLPSATTTYTIASADNGKNIYFRVSILDAGNNVLIKDSSSTITVNSVPVASWLSIAGDPRPGMTVWASYVYTDVNNDPEGGSAYRWYISSFQSGAGATEVSPPVTTKSYKVKDDDAGKYIGYAVIPGAATGSTPGTEVLMSPDWLAVSSLNDAPVVTNVSITGTLNTGDVLTGHYTYSDYEGDLESGSVYRWYRRSLPTDSWSLISEAAGISYLIVAGDTGKYFRFGVIPRAATGTDSATEYFSPSTQKSNNKPWVSDVYISGNDSVGETLTAHWTFYDDHDGQGASMVQWYRSGVAVTGETSTTYLLTGYDFGKMITFRVTPVTDGTGEPVAGDEVTSSNAKGPVEDPTAAAPTVTQICIDGIRKTDNYVYGKYVFVNKYDEYPAGSEKIWYSDGVEVKRSRTSNRYKLKEEDIGKTIEFAVIPENNIGQKGTMVTSDPLVIFDIKDIFSETDPAYMLKSLPVNGEFYGTAVDTGYFAPAKAGSTNSPYTLTCILNIENDSTTCTQTAYKSVTVNPVTIEFAGINDVYCDSHGEEIVSVINVPATAVAWAFDITDLNAGLTPVNNYPERDPVARFYPDQMQSGDKVDVLYFYYLVYNPFLGYSVYSINKPLVINHIDSVSIMNLDPGDSFCSNIQPFELYGYPSGGIFDGPMTGNKLDPSKLYRGYGDSTVTYTYTSSYGCQRTVEVPVSINPLPQISFVPADFCILDENDSTRMVNNTVELDSVRLWTWEFSEGGITSTSNRKEPAYLYKIGGDHRIVLTAVTVNDCTASREETFDLGIKPVAGFTWENECYHENDSMLFFDATITSSVIKSRRWIFYGQDTISDMINPKYPQKATGYMPVKYLVTTGYEGCDDSITYNVYIRPTITIPGDGYSQNFDAGKGDWVQDYAPVNSWTFGTPDREIINTAASGVNAWFTRFDSTVIESSSVISPCFNFDSIERPMIRLWLWKRFDWNRDGAALQYKIGDAGSWEYVGTLDDGILWYNSTLIKGRPGGDQLGWTSRTSDTTRWAESRHKIDEVSGKKDVKFRLIYGSDGTAQDNDGVAFDEVWIGERTRSVLLEHFANLPTQKSYTATGMVNTIALNNPKDVINIQFHTNFPGTDPYYNDNPGDNSARILYYGLTRAPYSFIDGGNGMDYAKLFDYTIADISENDVIRRSLINPFFEIILTSDTSNGILTVNCGVRALENISAENMTLYLAVTEKENDEHTGYGGETIFYNVFRKMIPDGGGITLKNSWTKDETYTVPEQIWLMSRMKDISDIEVIAFIQNNITKEIYQAASEVRSDIVVGIEDIVMYRGTGFTIWPNPAVNKLTIGFKEPLKLNTDIRIYDVQGILLASHKAGAGTEKFTIDDLNLDPGLYVIRVSAGSASLGFRKLVITGR